MFTIFKPLARTMANNVLQSNEVKEYLDKYVGRYADVQDIKITDNGVALTAQLNGSTEVVHVEVGDLRIDKEKGTFSVNRATADMPWVENILADLVVGEQFPLNTLPQMAVSALEKLVSVTN